MEGEKGGYPFEENLETVPGTWGNRIKELRTRPDLIIREQDPTYESNREVDNEKNIAILRSVLARLRSLGVRIPDAQFVIGKNNFGTERVFIILPRIDGTSSDVMKKLTPQDQRDVDNMISILIREAYYSFSQRQPFFWDVKFENIMKGRLPSNPEEHLYLTDIGFEGIAFPDSQYYASSLADMRTRVNDFLWSIKQFYHLSPAVAFPLTTAELEKAGRINQDFRSIS